MKFCTSRFMIGSFSEFLPKSLLVWSFFIIIIIRVLLFQYILALYLFNMDFFAYVLKLSFWWLYYRSGFFTYGDHIPVKKSRYCCLKFSEFCDYNRKCQKLSFAFHIILRRIRQNAFCKQYDNQEPMFCDIFLNYPV